MKKETEFKKTNKPAVCNLPPWYNVVPYEDRFAVLRQIRQESIDIYKEDYSECPKRKVCFGQECLGRPLPVKSKTFLKYYDKLKTHNKIVNDELFIDTSCTNCPILNTCSSPCKQIDDYINRHRTEEPGIVYKYKLENVVEESEEDILSSGVISLFQEKLELPWDALSERRQNIIKQYYFEKNDFKYIAEKFELLNEAKAKYEFYAGLTTLSECAIFRKFLKNNKNKLKQKQLKVLNEIYINNNSITETARILNLSVSSTWRIVNKVVEDYNIKWTIFVRKENKKIIYSNLNRLK